MTGGSVVPPVRDIIVLGSTGSTGTQAVDVIARNRDRFRIAGLCGGGGRTDLLARQAIEFDVPVVAIADAGAAARLRRDLDAAARDQPGAPAPIPEVLVGPDAACELAASPCHTVLNAITGAAGLPATLAALDAGRTLALANKESLIVGGRLVKDRAAPGQIVPVDSEHSALAQCLRAGAAGEVRRLIITASGGPFRGRTRAEMAAATLEEALAHPTWRMGPVITINSATLVNKGLEVIEAHLLFDIPFARIDVVIHPQSMVHSMAEFVDGSVLAQVSPPDMRLPIALGLAWPDRVPGAAPAVDWTQAHRWEFEALDETRFPAVRLARQAGQAAGAAPAVYNAANEECVSAFQAGRIAFTDIIETVERVLSEHRPSGDERTLAGVLAADWWARARARELMTARAT